MRKTHFPNKLNQLYWQLAHIKCMIEFAKNQIFNSHFRFTPSLCLLFYFSHCLQIERRTQFRIICIGIIIFANHSIDTYYHAFQFQLIMDSNI